MAYNEMQSRALPHRTDVRWFHSETVTDATSDPLILPSLGRDAAVSVTPGTGATVQYTLSSYADVINVTATWHDWPAGSVTEATVDGIAGSASALRLLSTGASEWEVAL
ncbi:hypothetical protein [Halomonas borealis]|uniref:hypothetical protein n=1 Tax=Halomonas borealis TaxID=2508710 RepID=UPI00109F267C|nr:hypothetical protein [Halomonas borealis]